MGGCTVFPNIHNFIPHICQNRKIGAKISQAQVCDKIKKEDFDSVMFMTVLKSDFTPHFGDFWQR